MKRHYSGVGRGLERAVCATLLTAALAQLLTGCGQTGVPLPPSLNLPDPVADLSAIRAGNAIQLRWTMPRRTTDKLPLKGDQTVRVCRKLESGACENVADQRFEADKAATYEDALPPELTSGPPRLLTYYVEVRNRQGHALGASNPAYTAAGEAPPPIADFAGKIQASGVLLQWTPVPIANEEQSIQLQRILLSAPPMAKSVRKPAKPDVPQTLAVEAPENTDPGKALDTDALFDRSYSYRATRIVKLSLAAHSVQMQGVPSAAITVDAKDVFPPGVPGDLAVVPVPDQGSIDLSWTPDTEPDLAGYIVFRRDAGSTAPPRRISQTLADPSFRDPTAQRGREYAYSLSAVDRDGNESARSPEVTESLPQNQETTP